MNLNFFKVFSLILALTVMPVLAQATPQAGTPPAKAPAAAVTPTAPTQVIASEPPTAEDLAASDTRKTEALRTYVQPSYTNMAKSLWALNVPSLDDDRAIDNFLKITECGLYSRFFTNEFEWKKIRDATRDYLKKYKNTFPRRYEYVQPLLLDRYDFALKGFRLMPDSAFVTSSRLEMVKKMQYTGTCDDVSYDSVPGYPNAMMIMLKQPFSLSFVRINEDLAQEYLKILTDRQIDITKGRPAYIRFRVRFDRYVNSEFIGQDEYAIFGGTLETIEVFADRDLMFKLYEQSLY